MTFRLVPLSAIAGALVGVTLFAAPIAQKPEMKGYPAKGEPPVLTVIKDGSAPRTQLRYVIATGQKFRMDLTMSGSMTIAVRIGDVEHKSAPPVPTMKVTAELAANSVTPNADIAYDVAFQSLSLEPPPGVDAKVLKGLQPFADLAASIKGTATVSSSGVVRSTRMDVPRPEMEQVLGSIINAAEHLVIPFPDTAIGAGARWQVREAIEFRGVTMFRPTVFQQTEYEVLSIQGRTVSLQVKSEQTGLPQPLVSLTPPITNQGIVFGAQNRLEKMSGSSSGKVVVRLDSLVPASERQFTTSIAYASSMNDVWASNTIQAKTKMTIAEAR